VARCSRLVVPVLSLLLLSLVGGCGSSSSSDAVDAAVRFDPCVPLALVLDPGTTADRHAGASAAGVLWDQAASAQLFVPPAGAAPALDASGAAAPTLPVHFEVAAAPSHGLFDPVAGDVLINDDLTAGPLTVTIAHEIGHAFGLVHVTNRPSVMNPGNLDVEPNAGDVAALAAIWGACAPAP
jgi:hypothetical protein